MSEIVSAKRLSEDAVRSLTTDLVTRAETCIRSPIGRFAHSWIAAVPEQNSVSDALDGFVAGDYSAGLFHHDASEAAIELLQHEETRDASSGSLLNLLDNADPSGRVHRTELAFKCRDVEPAKPVIAQYALRSTEALGSDWAKTHQVYERASRFIAFLEGHHTGAHGLVLTHSSRASGFDNDPLSAAFPPWTVEAPDTNTFMVLEYEALAQLAQRLGRLHEASAFQERASRLKTLIATLLYVEDERGGFYRALRWRHESAHPDHETVSMPDREGFMRPIESWASLLPLYAGIPEARQAERIIERLLDPDMYWGPHGVRTVSALSPIFSQSPRSRLYDHRRDHAGLVSNWCGPVWILSNYYLCAGLRRYGRSAEADELAVKTAQLLIDDLASTGGMHECYDETGTGLWPPRPTFVSWNVLVLSMLRDAGYEIPTAADRAGP